MSPGPIAPTTSAALRRAFTLCLPIAAASTCVALLVYGVLQQTLRATANDVPLALAQTTTTRLDAGEDPTSVLPTTRVDLAGSLEAFVMVFDSSGRLLASSATLHDQPPAYPAGVFGVVNAHGEDRVTWQPEPGVRAASVARAWRGGFVVAGRSLVLTEQHIDMVGQICVAGWLVTLVIIVLSAIVVGLLGTNRKVLSPI